MWVVDSDGSLFGGGDAVIRLMAVFPQARWAAFVARLLPPVRRKIRKEYQRVADSRGERSQKVPDAPVTIFPPAWVRLPE